MNTLGLYPVGRYIRVQIGTKESIVPVVMADVGNALVLTKFP
jgi:hypothetical protein